MINIDILENRWLKYKIKSFIPHAVIAFIVFILFLFYLFSNPSQNKPKVEVKPITIQKVEVNETKEEVVTTETKVPLEEKEVVQEEIQEAKRFVLNPSMDFLNNIQKSKEKKRKSNTQAVFTPKQNIQISNKTSNNDLDTIIKRFKANRDPNLGLFIAKKYYKKKDYTNAYNYSLLTNELDNSIEQSWIIFSKSLVRLHKKEQAISTLEQYISYSNSQNAKILLNKINTGKFQ